MKYSIEEQQNWQYLYIEQQLSCHNIALKTNVPVSTIKHYLKKNYLLKTNQQSKQGRISWNKGKKTGQIPWNKGMKGNYIYASPFLGKKSPYKGIARSSKTKQQICLTLRLNRWTGRQIYSAHLTRPDFLYFCVLCYKNKFFF